MQRLDVGLAGIEGLHDEVVVALLRPQQLHFSVETVLDPVLRSGHDLSQEKVPVKIRYFFVNVARVQSPEQVLNADIVPE